MSLFSRKKLQEMKANSVTQHNHTILLVDDEPANLTVLANMLQGDYNVETAISGEEALKKIAETDINFSVIISDQRMPTMTGIEMLERVRHTHPDIIRIILTGYTDVSALMDGINRAQIYQFLLKPINRELVLLTVRRGIEALERDQELKRRAMYDWITGLPNRYLMIDRAEHALLLAKRDQTDLAAIFIDIRRFKEVNESLGHKAGDALLSQIGKLLSQTLRESDTIAHLNSGRFAMLANKVTRQDVSSIVEKLRTSMQTPIQINGVDIDIDASFGVSMYPSDGDSAEALLQHAEMACGFNKDDIAADVFYDASLEQKNTQRLSIMGELKKACEEDQLQLFFQPKVSLCDNQVYHAEALIRWNHPERGFVSPLDFIPLAEQTGIIIVVTEWVVNKAIQQIAEWHKLGLDLHVAINVSAIDLENTRLLPCLSKALAEHDVKPDSITMEITESTLMKKPEVALATLRSLSELGVVLSIDDFGTGYSSMSQLKKMPVSELKIDRTFIMNLVQNQDDKNIVEATISLGHHLGLTVVAEGVEDEESVALLRGFGCDMVQGFFFSKPLDATGFEAWYRNFSQNS